MNSNDKKMGHLLTFLSAVVALLSSGETVAVLFTSESSMQTGSKVDAVDPNLPFNVQSSDSLLASKLAASEAHRRKFTQ